jgi:hypothetical protein
MCVKIRQKATEVREEKSKIIAELSRRERLKSCVMAVVKVAWKCDGNGEIERGN